MVISRFNGKYAFLSNFYDCNIRTEHLFQAMKTENKRKAQEILDASTPAKAKVLGRLVKLRPDWEDIKDDVMEMILRLKFCDPDLRQQLLDTGDAILVEGNTWNDRYWGACWLYVEHSRLTNEQAEHLWDFKNGKYLIGQNKLGKLLMKLREEYQNG